MKQRIPSLKFTLLFLAVVFVAFIAYKFNGVGAGNQANPNLLNGNISAIVSEKTNDLSFQHLHTSQNQAGVALSSRGNPARDQWISLTKAVVASQDWTQTIAMLKDDPDANRWLIIMSFQDVCSRANAAPLYKRYLPELFYNPRMPSLDRIDHAILSQQALKRCGNLDDFSQRTAWRRLPEVTSTSMGISPGFYDGYYKTGMTEAQLAATDKIVRTPEQLSQWLTSMSLEKIPAELRPEYFKQLKPYDYVGDDGEFSAVNWLITCDLGDGCGNGSIHRFQACMAAYYCSGNSVLESIETRHGAERMQVIRNVANLFLADLSKRGVDVFGFPKKKTP